MNDAVVIGAGPNGLVAANVLADAGWQVEVLEAQARPGGAVRSDREVHPDYVSDVFSSFYPLAAASPAITALGLEEFGLSWSRAPRVLAHPLSDGRCAVLHDDPAATAEGLARDFGSHDARSWERLSQLWQRLDPWLVRAMFAPFPPVRAGLALAARVRAAGGLRLARFAALPVRRLAEEEFDHEGPGLLLAGCALHADLLPESPTSAAFGWLMAMLGQQYGWPVPVGGSSALTDALVRRLEAKGGHVRCAEPVVEVVVRGGRAVGVRTAGGDAVPARRAVLADLPATALYGGLVDWDQLPGGLREELRRFHWDFSTVKIDWALDGPIPWTAPETARAGTVHLGADLTELSDYALQVSTGRIPARPFGLLGQMTTADPSRSPGGTESAWMYTHVPQHVVSDLGPDGLTGIWDERETEAFARRMEQRVERFAPGFRARIVNRRVLTPPVLQRLDENLVGGALNGGTVALHQQAVLRPVPGTGRPETPVRGLYLASSSAHPGGGVHGACGANAARAALRSQHPATRWLSGTAATLAQRTLTAHPGDGSARARG
ncbi:phytoene desaturase family protein [Streptacidiphilus neutrinimicus]|uniref:phytoene desaturase family protein n=1 Tax=Streptacidiphilus neutrinimicus TaxID=105420 RepID=UPI0005AA3D1F|nr:NAD(P)/FAD-dependent oxidoreductase [Streptacidiphilus neutrinimicus]